MATRGCSGACERAAQEPGACLSDTTGPEAGAEAGARARLSSHKAATVGTPRTELSGIRPLCPQGLQPWLPRVSPGGGQMPPGWIRLPSQMGEAVFLGLKAQQAGVEGGRQKTGSRNLKSLSTQIWGMSLYL